MKYRVKWVENNLGVTRSALRVYESRGLLSQDFGKYREYDEDDIQRIWVIKELQGLGYSLREIKEIASNQDFDFHTAMCEKIDELEARREELDSLIDFAKMVKLGGRIPMRTEMGSKTYQEHHEEELREYTLNDASEGISEMLGFVSKLGNDKLDIDKFAKAIETLSNGPMGDGEIRDSIIVDYLLRQLVQKKDEGPDSPEVQLIVSMIYDLLKAKVAVNGKQIPEDRFSALYGGSFINGDMGRTNRLAYTPEGCDFIADAMARFGGFDDKDDL